MSELLAPAGTLEKLKWAITYGADAVYFGTKNFSLRSYAGNLSFEEAKEGLDFLHSLGKKGFVTLNIYPFSNEYDDIIHTAKTLEDIGADAFIVADIGVLSQLNKQNITTPIHISTQANTMSYQTIMAYNELGAKRVNLARELSFEQIKYIQKHLHGIETEVFIHGAVCFSLSGRCAISDYMSSRRANRGACTYPCRWKYYLVEEQRPGEYLPVTEDERGLYFFNSKELALYKYLAALTSIGINSFKIEGRMKSLHYIASIVSFYRRVLDGEKIPQEICDDLLNRVNNRGYSEGFMKGEIDVNDYEMEKNQYAVNSLFVGNFIEQYIDDTIVFDVKNKVHAGETLELLKPNGSTTNITLPDPLITTEGQEVAFANQHQFLLLPGKYKPYMLLRRLIHS